jgi:hypothetical protein
MKKDSALLPVDTLINFFLADLAVLLDVAAGLAFAAAITRIFPYLRLK